MPETRSGWKNTPSTSAASQNAPSTSAASQNTPSTSAANKTPTRSSDKSLRQIKFVGIIKHQMVGSKLPSNQQVLEVTVFHLRISKLCLREGARLAASEVMLFWKKARIPMRAEPRVIEDVENLYKKWRAIVKNASRQSDKQKQHVKEWRDSMQSLFNIAS